MAVKKNIFTFLCFYLISVYVNSSELKIAENFILKAYSNINSNESLAAYYLEKSISYNADIPEYYYLKNLLIPDDRAQMYKKIELADKIIENIDNNFIVEQYILLKNAAAVYEAARNYLKSSKIYDKIILMSDRITTQDYLDYMKILDKSNSYDKMRNILDRAMKDYFSLDFVYYSILSGIKSDSITLIEFNRLIDILESNNYDFERLFHLQTLYEIDSDIIINKYFEYKKLYRSISKDIIYNVLSSVADASDDYAAILLSDWANADGLRDYRTNYIIDSFYLSRILEAIPQLYEKFYKYSGLRMVDEDSDGEWEILFVYDQGEIKEKRFDENQDGIHEKTIYFKNNKIFVLKHYNNKNSYLEFGFNISDGSVNNVLKYIDGELKQKDVLIKSMFKPGNPEYVYNEYSSIFIDYSEVYGDYLTYIKYFKGIYQYKYIDTNNDDTYDYKLYYKNNFLYKALRDTDYDNYFETEEYYVNGMLSKVLTKTDRTSKYYDYKEEISENFVRKLWDNNRDGVYEISVVFDKNGLILNKYYDLNHDNIYDVEIIFDYETINNYKMTYYRRYKDEWVKINTLDISSDMIYNKKWIIVSSNEIGSIPDDICFQDKNRDRGTYTYNGKKDFFTEGIIINDDFKYKIDFINGKTYLIDLYSNNFQM